MQIFKKIVILYFLCHYLSACISPVENTQKTNINNASFVSVKNGKFYLDDQPYFFAGANFWHAAYMGIADNTAGDIGNRKQLLRELDTLQSLGISNLRVLATSEKSQLRMALRPAIQMAPGKYDETLLIGLDFLLNEMAKRNMKAVLYLNNFWQWSGGMSQYVAWHDGQAVFDPDVTGDWNGFMQNSARFYRMPEAQKTYQQTIKKIITRTNSINGLRYRDDPTIMTWELANEPRPGSDKDGAKHKEAFVNWIDTTAQYIHSLAPNHLVTTGSEGTMGTVGDEYLFLRIHALVSIDYATFHLWPNNWLWFDSKRPEATYAKASQEIKDYINRHMDFAQQLKKPMVMEEFGIGRDQGSFDPSSNTLWRDKLLLEMYATFYQRGLAGDNIGGTNFWAWTGAARTTRTDYIWQEGDNFFGDPPQEPQGLFSSFDSDASTLEIFKKHATDMQNLHKMYKK